MLLVCFQSPANFILSPATSVVAGDTPGDRWRVLFCMVVIAALSGHSQEV